MPNVSTWTSTSHNSRWTDDREGASVGMIEINRTPSQRQLRTFGVLLAAFFALVGALAWWRFDAPRTAQWIWIAAGAAVIVYYAIPAVRRLVFLGWIYAALPIGWLISHLVLAGVYYLILTPMGLLTRLLGHDPLRRRLDPEAATYWESRRSGHDPEQYFRQY